MTLTETLHKLGYNHQAARNGRHEIAMGGEVLFVGRAFEVWGWLRETGEIK